MAPPWNLRPSCSSPFPTRLSAEADQPYNDSWNGNLYYDGNVGKLNINFNADFVRGRGSSDTETIESSLISPAEISANSKYKGTGAGQDAKSRMSN